MSIIKIGNKEYTAEEIEGLKAIIGAKNDPAGAIATSHPLYGPYQDGTNRYGVFSYPGVRPEMYSAFQRPFTFLDLVGVRPSRYANEKIQIMTGATDGAGANAQDFCATPPTPGTFKRCTQNYVWGKWSMKTELNNLAEAGEYADYADMEKRLMNLAVSPNPFVPDIMNRIDISRRDGLLLANELWQIGNNLGQTVERVAVRGNIATAPASTRRGWIREFNGLEQQIVAGKTDLDSGVACPGADSTVVTWGTGIEATVGGLTFVQRVIEEVYAKRTFADQIGMSGVQWAFVGSQKLFRALTGVWACQYNTSHCQGTATAPNFQNAPEVNALRLAMLNGQYPLIWPITSLTLNVACTTISPGCASLPGRLSAGVPLPPQQPINVSFPPFRSTTVL